MNNIQRTSLADFSRLFLDARGADPIKSVTPMPLLSEAPEIKENGLAVQVGLVMLKITSMPEENPAKRSIG
jgi:hypothetical protein